MAGNDLNVLRPAINWRRHIRLSSHPTLKKNRAKGMTDISIWPGVCVLELITRRRPLFRIQRGWIIRHQSIFVKITVVS